MGTVGSFGYAVLFTGGTLLGVAALAAMAGRLLDLHVGVVRTAFAGGLGLVAQALVGQQLAGRSSDRWGLLTVQLGVGLLVGVLALVLAEAVLPGGRAARSVRGVRGLRRRGSRVRRYLEIMRIARRHGLGPRAWSHRREPAARARVGRSLRAALEEGGVAYVKLGQMLATVGSGLPEDLRSELAMLHSGASAAPWADVEEVLREQFGDDLGVVFAQIDPVPLAAAAVAQVHRARLVDGSELVLKIQRPGVRSAVLCDLDIICSLARYWSVRSAWARSFRLVELADGFAASIREELDFRVEMRNTQIVAARPDPVVLLPEVHPGLCAERVLALRRFDGTPLSVAATTELDQEHRTRLAQGLVRVVLGQVMDGGVFHADPHPGNVLLLDDGRLALLDFGSVGRLDSGTRNALAELQLALDGGDAAAARDALLELVDTRPDDVDVVGLERAMGRFIASRLASNQAPDLAMFEAMLRLANQFHLAAPPELAAVFRSLITLDSTLRVLCPDFDLLDYAKGLARERLDEQLTVKGLKDNAVRSALTMAPMVRKLPRQVARITSDLEHGRLSFGVRLLADERDRAVITGFVHLILTAFIGTAMGGMAVVLLSADRSVAVGGRGDVLQMIGYNLLVVSFLLVLRVLFVILRRPRVRA